MHRCAQSIRVVSGPLMWLLWVQFWLAPGKFDFFWLFWGVLTCSDMSVGCLESFATLCMCVHMSDVSVWFSSPFARSPTCSSALLAGKSRVFDIADTFSGVFESLAMLYMCVHVSDMSIRSSGFSGSSIHSTVPLAGKSGITDTFSGLFKFLATLQCLPHMFGICVVLGPLGSSGHNLGLVPSEFDFSQLFWGVPTHSDMFSDLLKLFGMPCMHVHVSDMSVWLSSLSGLPCVVLHL